MKTDRLFNALMSFPEWLESFDALQIPAWTVILVMTIAIVGFIFAVREFLAWFLKTNAIVDEVVRLESLVRDLQADLENLELTVSRLRATTNTAAAQIPTQATAPSDTATHQFPLNN